MRRCFMKDENRNTVVILALIVGLVLVSVLFALNRGTPDTLTVAQQEQRETITVTETVEKETMPDEAHIYLEIKTRAETAQEAKNDNAQINDAVLIALEEYGLDKDQIETTSYYLNEETKWDKDKEEYITTGYVLTHIMKVTTEDIDAAGEIIDTAVDAGATGIDSVQFTLSKAKESDIKGEALALAAEKAKTKAAAIVDAVAVDLGQIISITESSYYSPYPWYSRSLYAMEEAAEEVSYDTTISPEELTVSATVTLTYEIEQ